ADINADGANHYAGQLKSDNKSARTIQATLTALKAFTRWLANNHKLPRDPLASVSKPNPKADRRRERRMMLPGEGEGLRSTIGGPHEGFPANGRVLLCPPAIQTGLRSSELRSLTRARLFLDANEPFIVCKAGSTKNRKDCRQYITPDLAAEL